MRASIGILAGAAFTVMAADAALANASSPPPPPEAARPTIKVVAPERVVCRPITRTGTRIDLSAVCRTREEWSDNRGSTATRSYRDLDHLADRLATMTRSCDTCWKD